VINSTDTEEEVEYKGQGGFFLNMEVEYKGQGREARLFT
jgi:hypothetical protein